jgi:hypothetical protein
MQGKLEPDARQALIAKGQQLKQQLEELEAKLVQVIMLVLYQGLRLGNSKLANAGSSSSSGSRSSGTLQLICRCTMGVSMSVC